MDACIQDRQRRMKYILSQNKDLLDGDDDYSELEPFKKLSGSAKMTKRRAEMATMGLLVALVAFGYIISRARVNTALKSAWLAASTAAIKAYEIITGKTASPNLGDTGESPAEIAETPVEAPAEMPTDASIKTPVDADLEAPVDASVEAPVETPVEGPVDAPAESPVEGPPEDSYWPTPEQLWYLQSAIGLVLVLYGLYELYQTWNVESELAELENGVQDIQEKITELSNDRMACTAALDALRDACEANHDPSLERDSKVDFLSLMEETMNCLKCYRKNIRSVRRLLEEKVVEYESKAREISRDANSRSIRTGVLAVTATACAAVFQPGLPVVLASAAGAVGIAGAFWSTHQVRRAREVVENLEKCENDLDKHRESYNKLLRMFRKLSRTEDLDRVTRQEAKLIQQEAEVIQLRAELAKLKGQSS